MPTVRPFHFSSLERWTQAQLAVLRALHGYLPSTPFTPGFKAKLSALLKPYINCDIDIWLDAMTSIAGQDVQNKIQQNTLVAVLGLPPDP